MTNEEFNNSLRNRLFQFVLKLFQFLETTPKHVASNTMSYQLCKAATSVGSNHRAFCRSRSQNERYAKICIVVEEADETQYWLELFHHTQYGDQGKCTWLLNESTEIVKIMTSIKHNMKP